MGYLHQGIRRLKRPVALRASGLDCERAEHIVTQGLLKTLSVAGIEWQKKGPPRVELKDETRKVEEMVARLKPDRYLSNMGSA